jgi:hypothetical protein
VLGRRDRRSDFAIEEVDAEVFCLDIDWECVDGCRDAVGVPPTADISVGLTVKSVKSTVSNWLSTGGMRVSADMSGVVDASLGPRE